MLTQFEPGDERVRVGAGTTVSGEPLIAGGNHPLGLVRIRSEVPSLTSGDIAGFLRRFHGDGSASCGS